MGASVLFFVIFQSVWIAQQVRTVFHLCCWVVRRGYYLPSRETCKTSLHIFLFGNCIAALDFFFHVLDFLILLTAKQMKISFRQLSVVIREMPTCRLSCSLSCRLPTEWNAFSLLAFIYVAVKALIDQEVKNGIPSNRIILGGFSQVRYGWKELCLFLGK